MTTHEIVIRPTITGKNMSAIGFKKYTLRVARNATKTDIAHTVGEFFKVKVAKVDTLHICGHLCHQSRAQGYTVAWKKAIVSLTEDSKPVEFSEGIV